MLDTRKELLTDIHLHGELGARFGEHHRLAVRSVREAVDAIEMLRPGFLSFYVHQFCDGVSYRYIVDDEEATELNAERVMGRHDRCSRIDIVPTPGGGAPILGFVLFTVTIAGVEISVTVGAVLMVVMLAMGIYSMVARPEVPTIEEVRQQEGAGFRGGVNISRPGVPLPLLYGEHLTGSVVISGGIRNASFDPPDGFYDIHGLWFENPDDPDGDPGWWGMNNLLEAPRNHESYGASSLWSRDQIVRILDLISEGPVAGFPGDPAQNTFLDEVPLKTFRHVQMKMRLGTGTQTPIDEWASAETNVSVGTELFSGEEQMRVTSGSGPLAAVRINLAVMALSHANDTGPGPSFLTYKLKVKDQATGLNWSYDRQFFRLVLSRRNITEEIPVSGSGPFEIRIEKRSADSTSKTQSVLYWSSYVEIGNTVMSYPFCALNGVQFQASEHQTIPRRNYLMRGRTVRVPSNYDAEARTYSGDWDGTFAEDEAFSANPIWCLLDLLTSTRYGVGEYINDDLVNLWSFYRAAKRCDELVSDGMGGTEYRYTFNAYLFESRDSLTVCREIAASAEAYLFWDGQKLAIMQDAPTEATDTFTPANVVDGIFQYVDAPLRSKTNRVLVEWHDPDEMYRSKLERVDNREGIAKHGVRSKTIVGLGVTSRGLARRRGLAILETEQLTDSVRFKVGLEGAALLPGTVIKVLDPYRRAKVYGGRSFQAWSNRIGLDREVVLESGVTYTLEVILDDVEEDLVAAGNSSSLTLSSDPANNDARLVTVWEDADDDGEFELKREPIGYDEMTKELSLAPYLGSPLNRNYQVFYMTGIHSTEVTTAAGTVTEVEFADALPEIPSPGAVWTITQPSAEAALFRVVAREQSKQGNEFDVFAIPYDPDKYDRIDDQVDVHDPDPGELPPWNQGVAPPPPVGVETRIEIRRYEGQVVTAIVVSWGEPEDGTTGAESIAGYRVMWRYESDSPEASRLLYSNDFAIPAVRMGTYEVSVASEQLFSGRLSSAVRKIVHLTEEIVPELGMQVSGLTVQGRTDNNWTGPDLALEWNLSYVGSPEMGEDLNEAVTPDNLFEGFVVQIVDGDTLENVGAQRLIGPKPEFVYPYTQNKNESDDGLARRDLIVRVAGRDTLGRYSPWSQIAVKNEAPVLPTLIEADTVGASIFLRLATPALDPDFEGYIVWMSTSIGFEPDPSLVAFKGKVQNYVRIPVEGLTTYYIRYAAYDAFTDDPDNLTVSEEIEIEVGEVVDPQHIVDVAVIGSAQIDELSANKIQGGTLDVDVIAAKSIRGEHLAFGSVDNLVSDPAFDALDLSELFTDDGGGSGTWGVEETLQYNGARCARFDYGGDESAHAFLGFNSNNPGLNAGHVAIFKDDWLYFEFWARAVNPLTTPGVRAVVEFYDETGTLVATALGDPVGDTTSWERAFIAGEAPANAYYAVFLARADDGGSSGEAVLIDAAYARRMTHTDMVEVDAVTNRVIGEFAIGSTFVEVSKPSGPSVSHSVHGIWSTGWGDPHQFDTGLFDVYWNQQTPNWFIRVTVVAEIIIGSTYLTQTPIFAAFCLVDTTQFYSEGMYSENDPGDTWQETVQTHGAVRYGNESPPPPERGSSWNYTWIVPIASVGTHRVQVFFENSDWEMWFRNCTLVIEEPKR